MQSTFERTNSRNFFPTPAPTIPADTIRLARLADARQISDLIEHSSLAAADGADGRKEARGLRDATSDSLDAAIRNGTCHVAESDGRIIGVCAWIARGDATGAAVPHSGASASDTPGSGAPGSTARVVALAVHPAHPPLALAKLLLTLSESAAARQGFASFDAVLSRPQRWLYLACGFRTLAPVEIACPNGVAAHCLLARRPISSAHPAPPRRPRGLPAGLSRSYRSFTATL
jgi:hypothetical protein